tara:strand:- start:452 stop:844 length:393 start_codon:yes stop_codon:yes gene_type:complete
MDPNFHVRHSVYYDFAAQCRTEYLLKHGLTAKVMVANNFGPILFREEAVFRKELKFGDDLIINFCATKLRKDGSRFSFQHQILKGEDVCATINVDGAWIDTQKRKLTVPPDIAFKVLDEMPKTEDFEWDD